MGRAPWGAADEGVEPLPRLGVSRSQRRLHLKGVTGRAQWNERSDGDASAASLRRAVHDRLVRIGFSRNGRGYFVTRELTKDTIRHLHRLSRREHIRQLREFVRDQRSALLEHFACGSEVEPDAIDPEVVQVRGGTPEALLFRFATQLWSVPVSQGFGRRMRFLVRDRQNGKLIGIFGLTDPVFNLSARDEWIGWSVDDRRERLVRVADAFVVGSVPPYSLLIGGKLVAALMTSREVLAAYQRRHRGVKSVISGKIKPSRLVLLTTTSALGRSSLYNRLVIPKGAHFTRIGETRGFGHFHLSGRLFERLREHLVEEGHPYAAGHRFGMGPNWRIRVVRQALQSIGLEPDGILKHGVRREVFAIPLASNFREILTGRHTHAQGSALKASDIAEFCLARWVVPRSIRDSSYRLVTRESILAAMRQ